MFFELLHDGKQSCLCKCRTRTLWAVNKAKENIKKHYLFVGVLEDLDTSLHMLEVMLPRYFQAAREIYRNPVRFFVCVR